MTPTFDRRRVVAWLAALASTIVRRAVVVTVAAMALLVAGAAIAASRPTGAGATVAHTRVTGSTPADGSSVGALPERVTVTFAAKAATVEGDPLLVYDAAGRRVDDGDVRVEDTGDVLSVGIVRGAGGETAGEYTVVYRVVSADTHVIAGRLGFTVTGEVATTTGWMGLVRPDGEHPLHRGGPPDRRPELLVALTALVVGITVRRTLRPRAAPYAAVPIRVARPRSRPNPSGLRQAYRG